MRGFTHTPDTSPDGEGVSTDEELIAVVIATTHARRSAVLVPVGGTHGWFKCFFPDGDKDGRYNLKARPKHLVRHASGMLWFAHPGPLKVCGDERSGCWVLGFGPTRMTAKKTREQYVEPVPMRWSTYRTFAELLTLREAAEALEALLEHPVSVRRLRYLANCGAFPTRRPRGRGAYLIFEHDLAAIAELLKPPEQQRKPRDVDLRPLLLALSLGRMPARARAASVHP